MSLFRHILCWVASKNTHHSYRILMSLKLFNAFIFFFPEFLQVELCARVICRI